MAINILFLLGGAGVFQSLFVSLCVLSSQLRKATANILLLLINFFLVVFLIDFLYLYQFDREHTKHFSYISVAALALEAPLVLLFTKSLLNKQYVINWKDFIHVLPVSIPILLGLGFCRLHFLAVGTYVLFYVAYSFFGLRKTQTVALKNKKWAYSILGSIALIMLLVTIYSLRWICGISISIGFTSIIYAGSFLGFMHYRKGPLATKTKAEEKLKKLKMSEEQSLNLFKAINESIVSQKLYTDQDLALPKLAEALQLSVHTLSYIVNQESKRSFPEFIHQLRIAEACKLLLETETKVAAIAFDCGFNSLSTFYAAFKKETGMSPSEYRKQNVKQQG